MAKLPQEVIDTLFNEGYKKGRADGEIMKKRVYIVTNHDNAYSTAIKISEEQARAIDWLIELADLNYSCVEPTETDCEEI